MKNLNYLLLSAMLLCAFAGCRESVVNDGCIEYDLNSSHQGEIQNVFADVELIPLDLPDDYYPQGIRALSITDSIIAIADAGFGLYLFSADGNFIGCSDDKIGEGPGEFAISMGTTLNPYDSTLEILTPDRMNKYDLQLNLVSSTVVPTKIGRYGLMFEYIYDLSDSLHILMPTTVSRDPYRIFMFNSKSGELTEVQSYKDDIQYEFTMQESCWGRDDDGSLLFMPPCYTEYVYKMDETTGKINKYIHLIPANSFITKNEIESLGNTLEQQAAARWTLGKEMPGLTYVSNNRIFQLTTSQPTIRAMKYYVVSRDSGEVETFPMFKKDKQAFPLINNVDNNYAYSVMEKFRIDDASPELLLNESHSEQLDAIDPESLILLKYRIK
ncbi:MAG: 6-bladed beta-propeller [Muribaculaceae bacterium]|nr:6-bladed beta-propeller [Muribaculaceae bacterium]